MTQAASTDYPARLTIDYPDRELDRLSSALRILWVIPIGLIFTLVAGTSAGAGGVLFFPVLLMLVFRQKYPRWWFDFMLAVTRFSVRVTAYMFLMSDEYPSTDEEQYAHVEVDYPDVMTLHRLLPLVKWFLAIPHYIALLFLGIGALLGGIWAWFVILFTGRYPRAVFDYIEGVFRWALRVEAYSTLLVTDRYPPFELR